MAFELDSAHPCHAHLTDIMAYTRSATDLTKQLPGLARGGKFDVAPVDVNEVVHGSAAMFGRTKRDVLQWMPIPLARGHRLFQSAA